MLRDCETLLFNKGINLYSVAHLVGPAEQGVVCAATLDHIAQQSLLPVICRQDTDAGGRVPLQPHVPTAAAASS